MITGLILLHAAEFLKILIIIKSMKRILKFYEKLTDCLKDVTEIDITDSLSPNKGYNINNIKDLDLTDDGHGALLQLFVQCSYFGYNIMEIPSESASSLGKELSIIH